MKPAASAPAAASATVAPAWRERSAHLFEEMRSPARAMIRRAFRGAFSGEEIDDIYSSAWLGVLRALGPRHQELTDEEARSYVLTAVAHQAGKELRRRRRKPTAPLELVGGVPDASDGPAERVAGAEQSQITRDLLASLPPRRRAVMLLRYGWGLEPRQVCRLVSGLSPRAYRKEITRGVDELTEKIRVFEEGDWCAEREPLLKAYAAGLASTDESRQAKAHLVHCRECAGLVARLSGHLHDVGAALAVPATINALGSGSEAGGWFARIGDRARETVGDVGGRGLDEAATHVAAAGGTRGAGVAGAGLLAKLSGLGAAGKIVGACIGGGIAATACLAVGVSPLPDLGSDRATDRTARSATSQSAPAEVVATPAPTLPPSHPPAQATNPGAPSVAEPRASGHGPEQAPDPSKPVSPDTPPVEQEFGVAPAAVAPPPDPAPAADTGSAEASAVRQEFAP